MAPRETENNAYAKFRVTNREYYGMLWYFLEPGQFCSQSTHRKPTQSVCVADCYFIVNVLDLTFASPIAIYR